VTLSGTLTLPRGQGPFPGAVLIAGSGPQDRDEQLAGHRPFLVLSDFLTRHGVAVLRYDKRGIRKSTGSYDTATTFDFAADAEQALAFLKARPEVDAKRLGLLGHSEGGLIGPIVAARSPSAAFLVLLAGPALPGEEILAAQFEIRARRRGDKASTIAMELQQQQRISTLLKQRPEDVREQLRTLLTFGMSAETLKASEDSIAEEIHQWDSPWFRTFLALDPRPYLQHVKIPVLALFCEKDVQVPAAQNRRPMERALRAGGNPRVEVRVLPGLNHLFQPAHSGDTSEYQQIETTMDPAALESISAWILSL
jgi:hypothetical protein